MKINKKTWCPRCDGSLKRIEQVIFAGGLWPKKILIIYKCDDCTYENILMVKLNKKMSRRLRYRIATKGLI